MNGAAPWQRVSIVGCGLIGASFALALKRLPLPPRVAGWDLSAEVLAEALRRGVIDEIDHAFAERTASRSELIYLAMPVGGIIEFLSERGREMKKGAVITDAGSTKTEICAAARAHLPPGCLFVGGHPVAGSHQTGLPHARADLFENAPYVLTPETEDEAVFRLRALIEALGARLHLMRPVEHDRAMAFVSHLPQLLASALRATVEGQPAGAALAGPGYRDMTRLAASSWSIWRDILATNSAAVAEALDACVEILAAVRDELRSADRSGDELSRTAALFDLNAQQN